MAKSRSVDNSALTDHNSSGYSGQVIYRTLRGFSRIKQMSERAREVMAGFTRDRGNLIPILQRVQAADEYLTPEAIAEISRFLDISENDIYSVASFYSQFRFSPDNRG